MDLEDFDDNDLGQLLELSTAAEKDFSNEETTPGPEHLEVLSKYFGHKTFRPLQWEIISAIIKDHRDVCAVMCTGYGKSICFQYPSTFMGGLTLVISPLISLMEDQILSLQVSNIPACLLGSAQRNQAKVIEDIFKNLYSLVYLTPEFCTGDLGGDILKRMSNELSVCLIAIDEAHCISTWGHDFRHQYRKLGFFHNVFPQVPIMAVTATATSKVRKDIISSLKLRNPLLIVSSFNRPNLYFEVNLKGSNNVHQDLTKAMTYTNCCWRFSGPTIIYCITRKQTEDISEVLKTTGINCRPYHAGLSLKIRQETHEEFVRDKIDVIVGTLAFGMGIDKPDVRNIIHYGCSKSVENYYQEVGRAGRDGLPANCITFYSNGDFATHKNIELTESSVTHLKIMENYLTTRLCRRKFILDHFEDNVDLPNKPQTNCCDNCTKKLTDSRTDQEKYEGIDENGCYDFTKDAQLFLKSLTVLSTGLGLSTYIMFLRGSKSSKIYERWQKHPLHGCGKSRSEEWWKAIGRILIQEKYVDETKKKTGQGFPYYAVSITQKGTCFLRNEDKLLLPPPVTIEKMLKLKPPKNNEWSNVMPKTQPGPSKPLKVEAAVKSEEKKVLYDKLLERRAELATEFDCMPYSIASNTAIMKMAQFEPKTLDELRHLSLDGFTEAKIVKFGEMFLAVINTSPKEETIVNKSIQEILARYPLPGQSRMTLGAEVSCTLLKSGLTIGEIAIKRGVTIGTISSHLISGIKCGHPIRMIELGVTEEIYEQIIKTFYQNYNSFLDDVRKKVIKEECPSEITYDHIGAVLAYLQIRLHLKKLNIPYIEFEDFQFREFDSDKKLDAFLDLANKIKNEEDSDDTIIEDDEPPSKREKTDFYTILDSPPSSNEPPTIKEEIVPPLVEHVKTEQVTVIPIDLNKFKKSKKKMLPPWLTTKKVD